MSIYTILFIILGMWIYMLDTKVKNLDKIIKELKESMMRKSSHYRVNEHAFKEESYEKDEYTDRALESELQKVAVDKIDTAIKKEEVQSSTKAFHNRYSPKKTLEKSAEPSRPMRYITEYFTGGNLLVRIGGVILFFGLAFLLKYVAEHSIISIMMRLWGIGLAAVALIATGWKLRAREGAYGQILQGLGVAMLYLVIYGASKFYGLLSLEMAFVLMLGVVVLGSVLAVIEDSLPLALFATAGGFLVPILTSSGEGSHIVLFSYYAFLNLGLFIVAWFRSWRVLNVVGFLFTFVIATAWGMLRYRLDIFATTEPFLILYFLMYLSLSILFTLKHPYEPKNLVDGTLVFGLPVIAFPLQVSLVSVFAYGEAYSAVALGVLYVGLWFWLKNKERTLLLAQSFLALSVLFFTIAIPYIFDADVSAALWALEATGVIWIALKQNRMLTRYFGELLLFVSLFVYHESVGVYGLTMAEYLGYIVITIATLISAYLLDTHKKILPSMDGVIAKVFLAFGLVLWFVATVDILSYIHHFVLGQGSLLTLILGAVVLIALCIKTGWKLLIDVLQGMLYLGIMIFVVSADGRVTDIHPFTDLGAWLFTVFFLLHFMLLYLYRKEWQGAKVNHVVGLWFFVALGSVEWHYHTRGSLISLAVVPLVVSFGLLLPKVYKGWLEEYREMYQMLGVGGLLMVLGVWQLQAFSKVLTGSYIPVFNMLDMVQIMVLIVMAYWTYKHKKLLSIDSNRFLYGVLAIMGFLLITVIFARVVYYSQNVTYTLSALWQSNYFQTGLSLLWSLLAIVLMLLSKRTMYRLLWVAGFGLLLIVVLKLFFVELANSGTIERIVSFMVVGILLLLIGYFVPMPPNKEENDVA